MADKIAPTTPPTITLKHISESLAEPHQLSKQQAETILNSVADLVAENLKKGNRVRISGLGILQVRERAARVGRNPATGETIQIAAGRKIAFRAGKDLLLALHGDPVTPVPDPEDR